VRVVVLLSGVGVGVFELRLNELTLVNCLALHLSWRHRFAAYADLPSDERALRNRSRHARRDFFVSS